jgi:hypothetical protein
MKVALGRTSALIPGAGFELPIALATEERPGRAVADD